MCFYCQRTERGCIKSSFIMLAVLCIRNIVGQDNKQTALFFEKYANFQKVLRCDTLEMLKDSMFSFIKKTSFYIGIMVDSKTGDEYPHNYEHLVSVDLFNRVQKIMEKNQKSSRSAQSGRRLYSDYKIEMWQMRNFYGW